MNPLFGAACRVYRYYSLKYSCKNTRLRNLIPIELEVTDFLYKELENCLERKAVRKLEALK